MPTILFHALPIQTQQQFLGVFATLVHRALGQRPSTEVADECQDSLRSSVTPCGGLHPAVESDAGA